MLALLLVLEARCTHFVIAHFINIVCASITAPTQHIYVTCYKDVSEHCCDCSGNSSAHVLGRGIGFIVIGLHTYHEKALVGSKVTSCQCTWRIYQTQDGSSCSSLPRLSRRMSWSTKSPATGTVKLPKLIARRDSGCLALCTL